MTGSYQSLNSTQENSIDTESSLLAPNQIWAGRCDLCIIGGRYVAVGVIWKTTSEIAYQLIETLKVACLARWARLA